MLVSRCNFQPNTLNRSRKLTVNICNLIFHEPINFTIIYTFQNSSLKWNKYAHILQATARNLYNSKFSESRSSTLMQWKQKKSKKNKCFFLCWSRGCFSRIKVSRKQPLLRVFDCNLRSIKGLRRSWWRSCCPNLHPLLDWKATDGASRLFPQPYINAR